MGRVVPMVRGRMSAMLGVTLGASTRRRLAARRGDGREPGEYEPGDDRTQAWQTEPLHALSAILRRVRPPAER